MILYLDTSGLAKLFIEEEGSDRVDAMAAEAMDIVTSVIAFPEMLSALGRRHREGSMTSRAFQASLGGFQESWNRLTKILAGEKISEDAGALVLRHGLRGTDGIHLASALSIRQAHVAKAVHFLSFDARLNAAAKKEGFRELFPG